MSLFSDKLYGYLKESGLNYTEIARRTGVDRSLLMKMKAGERTGDGHALDALCHILMLSAAQAEELHHLYLISKLGGDVYARHMRVKAMLEEIGRATAAIALPPPDGFARRLDTLPGHLAVRGRETVDDLLQAAIEQESVQKDACICLTAPPEDNELLTHLATAGRRNHSLRVEHLVCLQQNVGRGRDNSYNIGCFQHMLPLFTCGCRYHSFYYYDDVAARFSPASLLPCFLVTSHCCAAFSADRSEALVFKLEDVRQFYLKLFEKLRGQARPFLQPLPDALEHVRFYQDTYWHLPEKNAEFFSFSPVPCMAVFFDEALMQHYANRKIPDIEEVLRTYRHILQNIYGTVREMRPTSFFSAHGLRHFLQTGRNMEIPDAYYTPFSPPTRCGLLTTLLAAVKTGAYRPALVRTERFAMPENLLISALSEHVVKMVYLHPQLGDLAFTLEEPSLAYALYGFLRYLRESDLVYSAAESAAFIEASLRQTAPGVPAGD